MTSIHELVSRSREARPDGEAIAAPGRRPMTYARLLEQFHETRSFLREAGILPGDRVALVAPDGPETATAFLAIGACCACAPLNPLYKVEEFNFYFGDLSPKAVVIRAGVDSPARAAARSRGIPIIEMVALLEREAGAYILLGDRATAASTQAFAGPEDTALLLYTSGTTSRPKLIPLSQANLCASAGNTVEALKLTSSDRCLNMVPLFHVHGLIGTTLAALRAASTVICTPGFISSSFFDWLEETRPTWYSAAPAMHQSILARAPRYPEIISRSTLRLIRSASSQLPDPVFDGLERTFRVPVIEAYGMTEAASQITANPIPPGVRKRGSVGIPFGLELRIIDPEGNPLPAGQVGEVAVRGRNVISRYENNPEADAKSFIHGWLRSGDQGYLDSDGYLFIKGRLKELINRAGEKVSPYEVEGVLLTHPSVSEAAVFGVPDPTLGEEVGAAVVLKGGAAYDRAELLDFVSSKLADYKVPRYVEVVGELPRNATGKVQRARMAQILGVGEREARKVGEAPAASGPAAELSPDEKALAEIWKKVLRQEKVGPSDSFFDLGGDSILAMQITSELARTKGLSISARAFYDAPTLREFCKALAGSGAKRPGTATAPRGETAPLSRIQRHFLDGIEAVHGAYNNIYCPQFKGKLDAKALEASIDAMIARHEILRTVFPKAGEQRVQRIAAQVPPIRLLVTDLSGLDGKEKQERLRELATRLSSPAYDLDQGPMLRFNLVKLAADDHVLLIAYCHVILDRWSISVILRELLDRYCSIKTGKPSLLPSHPYQYSEYAHWEKGRMTPEFVAPRLEFWREYLKGAENQKPLSKRSHPTRTLELAPHFFTIDKPLMDAARSFSQREKVGVSVVMISCLKALVSACTGQTDIIISITGFGDRDQPMFDDALGLYINPALLRTKLSGNPRFVDVARQVQKSQSDSYRNSLPRLLLKKELPVSTRVNFNFLNVPPPRSFELPGAKNKLEFPRHIISTLELPEVGLTINAQEMKELRKSRVMHDLDINMIVYESGEVSKVTLWHRSDLVYESPDIEEFSERFLALMRDALRNPEEGILDLVRSG